MGDIIPRNKSVEFSNVDEATQKKMSRTSKKMFTVAVKDF